MWQAWVRDGVLSKKNVDFLTLDAVFLSYLDQAPTVLIECVCEYKTNKTNLESEHV